MLFGLPAFSEPSNLVLTIAWATFVSVLSCGPHLAVNGFNCDAGFRIAVCFEAQTAAEKFSLSSTLGVCVGMWFASAAYPLDWDRSWQRWPVPSIVGALTGQHIALIWCFLIKKNRGEGFRQTIDSRPKKHT